MTVPSVLLSVGILFWGWQTHLWFLALPMAIVLGASQWVEWRWMLSFQELKRIGGLNLLLLLIWAALFYSFALNQSIREMYGLFQWLPVVFLPLITTQLYSTYERIDIRVLFFFLSQLPPIPENHLFRLDLTAPYFAISILAASAANLRTPTFYGGMILLVGGVLWRWRPQRYAASRWILMYVLAISLGLVGHIGLHRLHIYIEHNFPFWAGIVQRPQNLLEGRMTSVGEISSRLSDQILFRVETEFPILSSLLLREATYSRFTSPQWAAVQTGASTYRPDQSGQNWTFADVGQTGLSMTVLTYFHQGGNLLLLPFGTFRIDHLPILTLEKNSQGTVIAETSAGAVSYKPYFLPTQNLDGPPTVEDLQIPELERPVLEQIILEENLQDQSPSQTVQNIEHFFRSDFSYSLKSEISQQDYTPITAFLRETRAGHCEYFATATTLLLRAAGIPARYAVGYSVHEFSPLEQLYVVRDQHAHAWTLVYLNGSWQELDTTPASWQQQERTSASALRWVKDLWSWMQFQLSTWISQLRNQFKPRDLGWLCWLAIPVGLRLYFRRQRHGQRLFRRTPPQKLIQAEEDQEFTLIEQALARAGYTRYRWETLREWVERLNQSQVACDIETLIPIVALHYRNRYDPEGITATEREHLKKMIQSWLEQTQ
jgi:transglutaminase-like putative cysteine protease